MRKMQKENKSYIVLEDLDFGWSPVQVKVFDQLWKTDVSLWEIADYFKRDIDEIALLVIDRMRKGKIDIREGGAFGDRLFEMQHVLQDTKAG